MVVVVEVRMVVDQSKEAEVGSQLVHQLATVGTLMVEVQLAGEYGGEYVELLGVVGGGGGGGGGGLWPRATPGATGHLEIQLGDWRDRKTGSRHRVRSGEVLDAALGMINTHRFFNALKTN